MDGPASPVGATVASRDSTASRPARHQPWWGLHDGSVPTLREVVRLYDRGGIRNPWLAPEMKPLGLTPAEIDALVAFMEALGGEGFDDVPPAAFPM